MGKEEGRGKREEGRGKETFKDREDSEDDIILEN